MAEMMVHHLAEHSEYLMDKKKGLQRVEHLVDYLAKSMEPLLVALMVHSKAELKVEKTDAHLVA